MKTKTFKIGERCQGGIITVEIKGNEIHLIQKQWDNSAGYNKGSNQSNAKENYREIVKADDREVKWKIIRLVGDWATSYHADIILKWIESKVKLEGNDRW